MQEEKLAPNGFPSDLASNSAKKSDKYGIAYAKAIEENWFKKLNTNSPFYSQRLQFQEYRAYRMGNQSNDRFKKYINPTGDTSWINLDMTPIQIIPKFVDIVKNSITDQFFRISVEAIDPLAKSKKDEERNKILARKITKQVMEAVGNLEGAEMLSQKFIPENDEELDFYMSTNFKMTVEIALEQAIKFTLDLNRFDKEVFSRIVDDIITLGIGGCRVYTHPRQGVVTRYVNPGNFVYSYTRDPFFGDISYAGEVVYMTISEIRERFNVTDESLLKELVEQVQGKYGNGKIDNSSYRYVGSYNVEEWNYSRYPYDNFKVEMLDFEFITSFTDKYEEKDTRYGHKTFHKKSENYTPPKSPKYKRVQYTDSYQMVLGGYKVIGMDRIFDYGVKYNLPRDKRDLSKTCLSFKMVAPNLQENFFTGYVQRMIPFADGMMRSFLKMQQIQQKQRPPGLAIDIDALDEVDIGGGQKLTPAEITDMYDETGNFIFSGRSYGGEYGNMNPIRELAVSYIGLLNEQITAYNHNLQQLRDVTGLNEFRDASQPSPEAGLGVAQIALSQSNNATKHINAAAFGIVDKVAQDVVIRIQDIFEYSEPLKKIYSEAIGKLDVDAIEMMDRIPAHLFGLHVEVDLSDDEKAYLMQDVQIALQSGQITIADKYMIQNMTNMKDAQKYLAMQVKKNTQQRQAMDLQKIEAQGQQIQQQSMASSQGKQMELQAEYTLKSQLSAQEHQQKMQQIEAEGKMKSQSEVVRGTYDIQEASVQANAKMQNQKEMEDRKDQRAKLEKTMESTLTEQRKGNKGEQDFSKEARTDIEDLL